jgi:hypothetical protein
VNFAEIPVTGGYMALVDLDDVELVLGHKWSALPTGNTVYAQRAIQRTDGRWTTQKLHTFLTGYALTDHRNGNGLDNRRSNLREATQSQNLCNRRPRVGASGFKGVTWFERLGKWKAQCSKAGKHHNLGYFVDVEDAARAYDDAARRLHGEFATLNFPNADERAGRILQEK